LGIDDGAARDWLKAVSLFGALHPAALGCLLAIVRDAWGRPNLTTKRNPVLGWIVVDGHDDFLKSVACDTEAEALVAALEVAPEAT